MQQGLNACASYARLVMGPIENNVYLVDDGVGCFVIDPTSHARQIMEAIKGRSIDAIVVTHGHWDHIGALRELRSMTGAEVIAGAVEAPYVSGEKSFGGHLRQSEPCPVDRTVCDGDVLEIGRLAVKVIATPGHTPGGICLFIEPTDERPGAPVLFSGDTLFAGAHGRVDFEESDPHAMRESLAKLAALPRETVVLPGHNAPTTIARELVWMRKLLG